MIEVYKALPEGTQAELIDATIYTQVSRVRAHQRTVAILSSKMVLFIIDATTKNVTGYFYQNGKYEEAVACTAKITSRVLNNTFEF